MFCNPCPRFLEPELYEIVFNLDNQSVPEIAHWTVHNLNKPFNGYGIQMVTLHDLRTGDVEDYRLLAKCYPSAKQFVQRVLYLLGLLFVSGIVHGTPLPFANCSIGVLIDGGAGDIKLSSFALSVNGQLLLIDFSGSARQPRALPALLEPEVAAAEIGCVTLAYRAPELSTATTVDSRVDIFSCGVMFEDLVKSSAFWKRERGMPFCIL